MAEYGEFSNPPADIGAGHDPAPIHEESPVYEAPAELAVQETAPAEAPPEPDAYEALPAEAPPEPGALDESAVDEVPPPDQPSVAEQPPDEVAELDETSVYERVDPRPEPAQAPEASVAQLPGADPAAPALPPHLDPNVDRLTPPPGVGPSELERAATPDGLPPDPVLAPDVEPVAPMPTVPATPQTSPAPLLRPGDPGEPFTFTEDISCWCQPGLPADWESWSAPSEAGEVPVTDAGYSPEWGTLEPGWVAEGEAPFEVVEPERPLSTAIGPGHANDVYWADQGDTQYCALYSVRSVISELYGVDADPQEIVTRAAQNGWLQYDANGEVKGVMPDDIDDILASYGVPSHATTGEEGAWQSLNDALVNDQRVVLALDSKEVDQGGNVGDVVGGLDSDHAIAVTGIDYGRGVVIVNDSARSAGLEIPLNTFYESWRDSNFSMTVTDLAAPGGSEASPPAGAETPVEGAPGYAMLGMTLTPTLAPGAVEPGATLSGMPAAPVDSVGNWWGTAAPIVECCVAMPGTAETGSVPAAPLSFAQSGGVTSALPGVDANGDGVDDFVTLDANQDGKVDTWVADTTASGSGDTMFLDADGDGIPDHVSVDPTASGQWSTPVPLSSLSAPALSTQSPVPPGQPGAPMPTAPAAPAPVPMPTPAPAPAPAIDVPGDGVAIIGGGGGDFLTPLAPGATAPPGTAVIGPATNPDPMIKLMELAAKTGDQSSMDALTKINDSIQYTNRLWTLPDGYELVRERP